MGIVVSKNDSDVNGGSLEDKMFTGGFYDNWNYYKDYEFDF